MLAYLVIRDGSNRTDVFRLIPGQTVTVGRAATNQIVIRDDRCSRYHAEIFQTGGNWTVHDLGSRNGTMLENHPLVGDHQLAPGEVITIGRAQLAFVHDLSKAFPDSSSLIVKEFRSDYPMERLSDPSRTAMEPATITAKISESPLLEPASETAESDVDYGKSLAQLLLALGSADHPVGLAEMMLGSVLQILGVSGGGVLLFPMDTLVERSDDQLEVVASRPTLGGEYHRVSSLLAAVALADRAGVLADIQSEGTGPHGAIVVPIRAGERVLGLLHVSAAGSEPRLTEPMLGYTLAVCDLAGAMMHRLAHTAALGRDLARTADEARMLRKQLGRDAEIQGRSLSLQRVSDQIDRASRNNDPLLICGETGVGKDMVARAIHFSSRRAEGPFFPLHCGAYAVETVERELLGQQGEAGLPRQGLLERGHGGTVFLDQIDQLSQAAQRQIVAILSGEQFTPPSGQPVSIDVRIIAATTKDLEAETRDGRFRHDLFVRLQSQQIVVPALHRRPEDVPDLARHYLRLFGEEVGRALVDFTDEALDAMRSYRWPGNVRELKNVVERAVIFARGPMIDAVDLGLPVGNATS